MSGELTVSSGAVSNQLAGLAPGKYSDDKAFLSVAAGAGFLPRVQLFGANSGDVKRGKIGMGRYGLVRGKEQIEDLTVSCNCLVLSWRPKAMRIDGDDITVVYNPQSEAFGKICADSEEPDSGCMYGPEFLIFLPEAQPACYATIFFSSKTMRREAPNLKGLIGKAATLKSHLIETKKFSWHGPLVLPCSTPLPVTDEQLGDLRGMVEKFNNPPETEVEAAPEVTERPR